MTGKTLSTPHPLLSLLRLPFGLLLAAFNFINRLRGNRAGFIGFLGLLAYFCMTFIMPHFIAFDSEVNLDEIAGPVGSRIQLAVHRDNIELRTFADLAGKTVGVVDQTGGPSLIAPYADSINIEKYRWTSRRAGPGIRAALVDLANKEIDAMLIFSKSVEQIRADTDDAELQALFAEHIVVSNPELGPPHLLGTDTQGRDIATHIVHGGRILILTAVIGGVISTVIALVVGSLSAMIGGAFDAAMTALSNLILAVPRLILLVVLAGLIRFENTLFLGFMIGLLGWPPLMRAIRAQVLSLRERDFVEAARSLGLSTYHIMFREMLPNMISYVMINFIFAITFAMYEQIALLVLGLAPIDDYTWGVMLYFGRSRGTLYNADGASMALSPVLAIAFFQVCLVLFARALEEIFDPRLRAAV